MRHVRFTAADADRAFDAWGSNCGPGAIAAIVGLTLDELRPAMGDFERKRYTNPTLMWEVLGRLGVSWRLVKPADRWPKYGLVRIQWEGPWTAPGVPMRVRYRHTHWIGANGADPTNVGIFDINAIGNGMGWCPLADWSDTLVPHILRECVPGADGRWHRTHVVEVDERCLPAAAPLRAAREPDLFESTAA